MATFLSSNLWTNVLFFSGSVCVLLCLAGNRKRSCSIWIPCVKHKDKRISIHCTVHTHAPFSFPWYLKWPWFMYVYSPSIKMLHFSHSLSQRPGHVTLYCVLLWQPNEKQIQRTVFPLVETVNISVSELLLYSSISDIWVVRMFCSIALFSFSIFEINLTAPNPAIFSRAMHLRYYRYKFGIWSNIYGMEVKIRVFILFETKKNHHENDTTTAEGSKSACECVRCVGWL